MLETLMEILSTTNSKSNDALIIFLWEIAPVIYFRVTLMWYLFKIQCSDDVIKYSTLFTPLLHCLLIYYTCDINICVEMDPGTHMLCALVLPPGTACDTTAARNERWTVFLCLTLSSLAHHEDKQYGTCTTLPILHYCSWSWQVWSGLTWSNGPLLPKWNRSRLECEAIRLSIPISSHFHWGICNGCNNPAGLWCSALILWQLSHVATCSAISLFIPYHQNFFFRSWYIFSLPGWIE